MALKEWCQELRPLQLYIMLTLTSLFFSVELAISHFTHSLTLLMDSYHMLCNIIALVGCLITIKKLSNEEDSSIAKKQRNIQAVGEEKKISKLSNEEDSSIAKKQGNVEGVGGKKKISKTVSSESNLKNTFGWARIDVLVMMIGCIFLFSLCFSLLVEALQTLVHIDHNDEMHFPVVVLVVAIVGLILNGFCYLLIGGYTFHQGSFFHVTDNGDVVLDRKVTADSLRLGQRRLSSQTKRPETETPPKSIHPRQGLREMVRDVIGCLHVVMCGVVVYLMSGNPLAKYLDPVISISSAFSLLALSYPYMKESGLILLQTIPNDINIDLLRKELLAEFPDIVNVHDLHVWQLTPDKVFATSHIVFHNPQAYLRIDKQLADFFTSKGITQATTQAEFLPPGLSAFSLQQPCLMPCMTIDCRLRNCCRDDNEDDVLENVQVVCRNSVNKDFDAAEALSS